MSINAGISFNSIRLNDRYRTLFGPGDRSARGRKQQFRGQAPIQDRYAVARKVGVYSSVGYFFTEFNNVIETPIGRFENEWDASSFNFFVGAMVYPFR